jgi:hypothetical protein
MTSSLSFLFKFTEVGMYMISKNFLDCLDTLIIKNYTPELVRYNFEFDYQYVNSTCVVMSVLDLPNW